MSDSSAPPLPEAANLPPRLKKLKDYLVQSLAQSLDNAPSQPEAYQAEAIQRLDKLFARANVELPESQKELLLKAVLDDVTGYGPIQPFLEDSQISEIMVNGCKSVYIERHGELIETGVTFRDDEHVLRVINRMVLPLGKRVDRDSPMVDARLPDGSRVNAVIPPVAVNGPTISIRKFLPNRMSVEELVALEALTPHMAEFLQACVSARLNILVTGPTSSGKTTFLNVLSGFIPGHERIVTIEDAVELQLKQKHVISLETQPPSVDGTGIVTMRDLVRNTLRMRPDRIIIGEVRTAEALDMLQAMNTGHYGSMATLHANSPRDAISRMETMVMMAGLELPVLAIRRQIASAIDLIVHLHRLTDGSRRITFITEVCGMESDVVTMMDIFKYEQTGISPDGKVIGNLTATGIRPMFTPRLEVVGYKLKGEIYGAGSKTDRFANIT